MRDVILSEKIRKIRLLKGFSQEYMANELQVSQKTYSNIERGESDIDLYLDGIAKTFDVSKEEIINFDEKLSFQNFGSAELFGYNNRTNIYKSDTDLLREILKEIKILNQRLDNKQ